MTICFRTQAQLAQKSQAAVEKRMQAEACVGAAERAESALQVLHSKETRTSQFGSRAVRNIFPPACFALRRPLTSAWFPVRQAFIHILHPALASSLASCACILHLHPALASSPLGA